MAKPTEPPMHFRDAQAFDAWLATAPGAAVWIKLAKQGSSVVTLSQREAIDCALCHGWIDGQIQRFDDQVYLTRFTPRKPGGRWSANNCRRAAGTHRGRQNEPARPCRGRGGEARRSLGCGLSFSVRRHDAHGF